MEERGRVKRTNGWEEPSLGPKGRGNTGLKGVEYRKGWSHKDQGEESPLGLERRDRKQAGTRMGGNTGSRR